MSTCDSIIRTEPDGWLGWSNGSSRVTTRSRLSAICATSGSWRGRSTPRAAPGAGLRGAAPLVDFRGRGGAVTILLGNHDGGLGRFYAETLGFDLRGEPLQYVSHDLRVHLVHGHLVARHRDWKAWMESSTFLRSFRRMPGPVATGLDRVLQMSNDRNRSRYEQQYYALYRSYAASRRDTADLFIIGHVHTPLDDAITGSRLIVLGGWHTQSSYLKVDFQGASLIVEPESNPDDCAGRYDLRHDSSKKVPLN